MSYPLHAPRPMQLILTATVVEEPREGISQRTGKRFANLLVAGYLGREFIRTMISVPDAIPISRFHVGEQWDFPLTFPQGSKERNVFLRLRSDADGLQLLRRVDEDADLGGAR